MITTITIKSTTPIPIPTVHGVNGPSYFGGGGFGVGVDRVGAGVVRHESAGLDRETPIVR